MEAFQTLLTVLVIIGLLLYAIDRFPVPIKEPAKSWIACIIALLGAAYLAKDYLPPG